MNPWRKTPNEKKIPAKIPARNSYGQKSLLKLNMFNAEYPFMKSKFSLTEIPEENMYF